VISKKNRVGAILWDDVQVGDVVNLRNSGRMEYCGEVDDRTESGDVVWVTNPLGVRRLFHIHDGYYLQLAMA
jgi:hypothetical protein